MAPSFSPRSRRLGLSFLIGIAAAWLVFPTTFANRTEAQTRVSIELVLAVDTSLSVDDEEFDLQMTGIANAFRHPEIVALIRRHHGVVVTLFQWSTDVDERFAVPWYLLYDRSSAAAFANAVARLKRDPVRGFTAIGRALEHGARLIAANDYDGAEKKIDLSGDGRNNTGVPPETVRRHVVASGITINALPILIDTYNMDVYFREKVIYGPGAFLEVATDYVDFAEAFHRKLKRELSALTSRIRPVPHRRFATPASQ